MKVLKIVALSVVGLIIVIGIGGYLFFKNKFTPEPNYLELTEASGFIPIEWVKSQYSDVAALLLPVKIKGVPRTFYLQFDTGTTSTLLYQQSLLAIQERYLHQITPIDSTSQTIELSFQLGEMEVHSKQFKLYDRDIKPIDWNDTTLICIGTLGADIIDKKLSIFDFINQSCYFGEELPYSKTDIIFQDLKYKNRRVLIPGVIAGKKRKLLHDTGTSGFDLITNKKSWKRLAEKDAKPEEAFKVKSWKRQLSAFKIASDKSISFAGKEIELKEVTYIEGASFMQHALMRITGMGGMIGNQLFMDKILILDCRNKKYTILDGTKP